MKFRYRLMVAFTLLIAVTFGVGGTVLISTSFYSVLKEEKEAAIKEYETVQNNLNMLNTFSPSDHYNNMSELLIQMETENIAGWKGLSLTSKGMTIYESGDVWSETENIALPNQEDYACVQTMEKGKGILHLYSELSTGQEILYLKASYLLENAYQMRENQQKIFLLLYSIVLLAGVLGAGILSKWMTRRLQSLANGVKDIAGGNLSKRTNLTTGDEFEQLSKDIDKMADKLEHNILKLEEDVERQEAFMGAVAHELKTPMTSIIGYADLIRQCALDENESLMAANYIYTEGKRLENLSYKILDLLLLEKEHFSMKEIQLDDFLQQVIDILQPFAKEKGVRLELISENITAFLEPDLAKSFIYNLIDNGIKATSEGGKVKINAVTTEDGSRILIEDNGCGMKSEELEKITEAFYRVDKSRSRLQGGAGLGLTLCKKIADFHHWKLSFQSKQGEGTRVMVEIDSIKNPNFIGVRREGR